VNACNLLGGQQWSFPVVQEALGEETPQFAQTIQTLTISVRHLEKSENWQISVALNDSPLFYVRSPEMESK
jgi:hypothetical protein